MALREAPPAVFLRRNGGQVELRGHVPARPTPFNPVLRQPIPVVAQGPGPGRPKKVEATDDVAEARRALAAELARVFGNDFRRGEPVYKVVTITEKLARLMLDCRAPNQRNLSEINIAKYARDMVAGTWRAHSGVCIAVTSDWWLVAGQNRMAARIRAGVDVQMHVGLNMPWSVGLDSNGGRHSSPADVLINNEIVPREVAARTSAILRKLLEGPKGANVSLTDDELKKLAYKHSPAIVEVDSWFKGKHKVITADVSAMVVRAYLHVKDHAGKLLELKRMAAILRTGLPLEDLQPRDRMVMELYQDLMEKGVLGRSETTNRQRLVQFVIKAYLDKSKRKPKAVDEDAYPLEG